MRDDSATRRRRGKAIAAASFTFGEGKGTSDSDLVDDDRVMVGFRDYAGKFAMPVMLLAVGTRFVLKIKQTAEVALKSGEVIASL